MTFDVKKCLAYFKDKNLDSGVREDAADSLVEAHSVKESADAFFEVVIDGTESKDFRQEVASCLGSVWANIGINERQLDRIEEQYKKIVIAEYKLCIKQDTKNNNNGKYAE